MALSLLQMYNARNGDTQLLDRVQAALSVHAKSLVNNVSATEEQKAWAVFTLAGGAEQKARNMMWEFVTDAAYPFPDTTEGDAAVQYIVDVHGELY